MMNIEARLKGLVLGPQDHRLREPLDVLGEPCLVKLAGADTDNGVAVVHLTVPKLAGPPLHRHSKEDEWLYVLDGGGRAAFHRRRWHFGVRSAPHGARLPELR